MFRDFIINNNLGIIAIGFVIYCGALVVESIIDYIKR